MSDLAALHDAVHADDADRLAALLDADPALVDADLEDGMTPLLCAAGHGSAAATRLLIERGADLEKPDGDHQDSPLGWAAFYAQREVAALLIAAGANLGFHDKYGKTPLGYAIAGEAGELRPYGVTAPPEAFHAVAEVLRAAGAPEA